MDLKEKVFRINQQVRHFCLTIMGKSVEDVSDEEFYRALSWALREEIMVNWTSTYMTHAKSRSRKIYYISMEYLPGRFFLNNVINTHNMELILGVVKTNNRSVDHIINSESDPGLGNGGLGRLASCFLDSLATQHYPAMGYGLRYQYGIFDQKIWYGVQVETPEAWLLTEHPWEMRRDAHAALVQFGGQKVDEKSSQGEKVHGISDCEEVRALAYDYPIVGYNKGENSSVLTLRLWSTKESPKNFGLQKFNAGNLEDAAKNTALTDVLYPNENNPLGRRMRLKQEFLLVSSSLQNIIEQHVDVYGSFKEFEDKVRIQINDTHPSLMIAEMVRRLTRHHDFAFEQAVEMTSEVCAYTNHTVLKEALEEWETEVMDELLPRQYDVIKKLNDHFKQKTREFFKKKPELADELAVIKDNKVRMANLCIYGSHKVNGVAKLHSEILQKSVFPEFHEMMPDKFTNVTNGVTQRRWLLTCNPELSNLITSLIGDDWIVNFDQLANLKTYAKDKEVHKKLHEIKLNNKLKLLDHICKEKTHHDPSADLKKELFLEGDAIFDIQIKRIHEYKRQLMNVLHAIMIYQELLDNPQARKVKRKIIIGGKAAPGYALAKKIIRLICCLSRKINEHPVGETLKIVFIENYNVSKASLLIPAADISEQISCAGQEASGTSCMKLSINGALTVGTDDGANVEMRQSVGDKNWPFLFGISSQEADELTRSGSYNPQEILDQHPNIKRALEALNDRSIAENDAEHNDFCDIYNTFFHSPSGRWQGSAPDRYFVLKDLISYYETQKKVEQYYQDPDLWAETVIHNIAGMGPFSSDNSIHNYAHNIWNITPTPIDPDEYNNVKHQFEINDRCYIPSIKKSS